MGGVVLVHGAWHTGWCWHKVASGLTDAGVDVRVTELHRGSLAGDAAAVQADVDVLRTSAPGRIVVCGHSYGGAAITLLAADGIAHLVYVSAFMLDSGETVLGALGDAPPTSLFESMQALDDGSTVIDPSAATSVFYADCSLADQEEAVAHLRPQAMNAGFEAPTGVCWREVPSTYVVCTEDHAVHPELQRRFAARASRQMEWPSSHSPFLSRPAQLVELLAALTRGEDLPGTSKGATSPP
jgi:pimeloyl-ACP methyl ester carboxylesterase